MGSRELPCAVMGYIFSHLPTVEDVRTSVLSRGLQGLWKQHPNLDFDNKRDFKKEIAGQTKFVKFVSKVLVDRDHTKQINSFRLKLARNLYLPVVADWLISAVDQNVVTLDLDISFKSWEDPQFELPNCIFDCNALTNLRLKLSPWVTSAVLPTSGRFPSVKFLHVTVSEPYGAEMTKLFSCCPVVETMIIDGSIDGDDFSTYFFLITAQKLKRLLISLECLVEPVSVHVTAPELESFEVEQLGLTNCYFHGSTKSLVNASIGFRNNFDEEINLSNSAMEILDSVCNVKSLYVSAHRLEDLCLRDDWDLPSFGHVNKLTLVFGDHNCWELLSHFLHNAPNLEALIIDDRTEGHEELEIPCNLPVEVPNASSNLKTIFLKGFRGRMCEMVMIEYLLMIGQLLNRMTISAGRPFDVDEYNGFYEQFLNFNRVDTCQVQFIPMHV